MQGIRGELEGIMKFLQLEKKNCTNELANMPNGRLYCRYGESKTTYYHALCTEQGYERPLRKTIAADSLMARQLARKRFLQQIQKHLSRQISQVEALLQNIEDYDCETLIGELPRAYRQLPEKFFVSNSSADGAKASGGWEKTDAGIVVPTRLIESAKEGTLTKTQVEEIREIQREWANQPYEINTKYLNRKKTVTSRGLLVRSKSEGAIAEALYKHDIPFRHDQVIHIGNKRVSPDFTFFSIINGEQYWEHAGKTNDEGYTGYHSYKLRLYEGVGIVPWSNYIETFDEADGYFDSRIIEAEIQNKLLRRLQLQSAS